MNPGLVQAIAIMAVYTHFQVRCTSKRDSLIDTVSGSEKYGLEETPLIISEVPVLRGVEQLVMSIRGQRAGLRIFPARG